MFIKDAIEFGVKLLRKAGVKEAHIDASVLLSYLLKEPPAYFIAHSDEHLSFEVLKKYDALLERRKKREPIAYLVSEKEFYGRKFYVNESVLIPRPDTETLVEAVLKAYEKDAEVNFLDLCAGSGVIGITLLAELPNAKGMLADISKSALTVAENNLAEFKLSPRAVVVESDLFKNITGKFDLITVNPPYIPTQDLKNLEPDVFDFEPTLALDGGEDGLAFYREIIKTAPDFLKRGGALYMELGFDEAEEVKRLMSGKFTDIKTYRDLAGIERVISGMKHEDIGDKGK